MSEMQVTTSVSAALAELPAKRPAAKGKRSGAARANGHASIDAGNRHLLIEQAAYFRAVARGFIPGEELEDWLAAETEVDAQLRAVASPPA